jgi:gas vesicle protein
MNIWKGLIIGGLTGAGAGIVLDALGKGAQVLGTAGTKAVDMAPEAADRVKSAAVGATRKAADMAPDAADRVKSAVDEGVARVHKSDLADHLRDQAKSLAHKVANSDQADHARETLDAAAIKSRKTARSIRTTGPLRSIG